VILRGQFTEAYAQEFFDSTIIKMVYLSVYLQALIYYILIFLELKKYHQLLIENFSDPFMGNYRWLKQFILLILVLMMVGLVKNILRFSSAEVVFSYASVIVALNILFFISWMMIVALRQPGIFTGIYSHMQPVSKLMEERGKTNGVQVSVAKSNPASTTDPRLEKLYRHMESREPYLDTSLSMHDLAGQLDMNVRDLSLLINHTLNQHFFDFVNRYRIEKAKELLRDPENHRVTVLEVLYEVGFNSKSSFNTTFKKLTGMTPTQYRKSVVH
jgi:AraC-like DNA-binding protein